jgi:hypothetical protein
MCTWCRKCVSYSESIGWTFFNAPYTILSHLDIVLLDEDENDPSNPLETLPILFASHKNYDKSFASFLNSLNTGGDSIQTNDIDFEIKPGTNLAALTTSVYSSGIVSQGYEPPTSST